MNLYVEGGQPEQLPQLFSGQRVPDLYIIRSTDVEPLLENIRTVGKTLERFSLSADPNLLLDDPIENWAMGEEEDVAHGMPNWIELKRANIDVMNLLDALSKIINFYALVRLETTGCVGIQHLLGELINSSENQELCLKHIVAEQVDGFVNEEAEDFRQTLRGLSTTCKSLKSVYLLYQGPVWRPQDVLRYFPSGRLRSLSLHCE
jgi:hypothetical protein